MLALLILALGCNGGAQDSFRALFSFHSPFSAPWRCRPFPRGPVGEATDAARGDAERRRMERMGGMGSYHQHIGVRVRTSEAASR